MCLYAGRGTLQSWDAEREKGMNADVYTVLMNRKVISSWRGPRSITFIRSCENEYNDCCLGFICHKRNSLLSSLVNLLYYQTNFLMSSSCLHDMVTLIEYFRQMPNLQIVKIWNSFKREKIRKRNSLWWWSSPFLIFLFSPNARRNNRWKTRSGSFCALVT